MILMDLQLNNLRGFRNFHLNTACPKETDNAAAPDAHLPGCPDFRYRKLVLVSGANGTGKTGIGRMLRDIFNFVSHQDAACLMSDITDTGRPAVCQMDFVPDGSRGLYRIRAILTASESGDVTDNGIQVVVTHVPIRAGDSYETSAARLDKVPDMDRPWTAALDQVPFCSWYLSQDSHASPAKGTDGTDKEDARILETVLSVIDPCVKGVSAVPGARAERTDILSGREAGL